MFVATKLAKIKRASLFVASPTSYARAAVAAIGYEVSSVNDKNWILRIKLEPFLQSTVLWLFTLLSLSVALTLSLSHTNTLTLSLSHTHLLSAPLQLISISTPHSCLLSNTKTLFAGSRISLLVTRFPDMAPNSSPWMGHNACHTVHAYGDQISRYRTYVHWVVQHK